MKNNISDTYPVGTKVKFRTGNFMGAKATVIKVDDNSKNPLAIYGFLITVKFDNGNIGYVEKTEHITIL